MFCYKFQLLSAVTVRCHCLCKRNIYDQFGRKILHRNFCYIFPPFVYPHQKANLALVLLHQANHVTSKFSLPSAHRNITGRWRTHEKSPVVLGGLKNKTWSWKETQQVNSRDNLIILDKFWRTFDICGKVLTHANEWLNSRRFEGLLEVWFWIWLWTWSCTNLTLHKGYILCMYQVLAAILIPTSVN